MAQCLKFVLVPKTDPSTDRTIWPYNDLPLDHNASQVRLLHLISTGGELQGRLEVASLHDKPIYVAVSYTWGEGTPTSYMICNDVKVRISGSLRSALLRFRALGWNTPFWVDQVCIDQSNDHERSYQVNLMTRIYSVASTVLVWIGEADEETDEAFKLAGWLSNTFCLVPNVLDLQGKSDTIPPKVNAALSSLPFEHRKWRAWFNLLQRPWFMRVWVMQEVSFCIDTRVYCGDHVITYYSLWTSFTTVSIHPAIYQKALDAIKESEGYVAMHHRAAQCQNVVLALQQQMPVLLQTRYYHFLGTGSRPLDLFRGLCMIRPRQCKRPEDKINGVIKHLATYAKVHDIPESDCTLSPEVTYRRITRFLIAKGIGIHVLLQSGLQQSHILQLPTWCPDYSSPKPTPIFFEAKMLDVVIAGFRKPESNAKYEWMYQNIQDQTQDSANSSDMVRLGPTDDIVVVRGSLIDSINDLGPVLQGSIEDIVWLLQPVYTARFIPWDQESSATIESSLVKARKYPTEFQRTKAYAQTIVAADTISRRTIKDPYRCCMALRTMQMGDDALFAETERYLGKWTGSALNRRIGVTRSGHIGLFPHCAKVGDKICVVNGSEFPLIIRRTMGKEPLVVDGRRKWTFGFVGDSYVHDLVKRENLADTGMERPLVDLYLV